MIEGAVALAAQDDDGSSEIHVTRKELEIMLELSGNGNSQYPGADYIPLGPRMRTAVAIAVVTAAVSIFIWHLPISWARYPHSSQWSPNAMRNVLNGVIGFRMDG